MQQHHFQLPKQEFCFLSGLKLLTQFCQKNIAEASVPSTGSLLKVQWTPSFNPLNTHLVSKICHNENEAESEASEVFPPVHGEPPWKTIIIPDRKITTLNFYHTAPFSNFGHLRLWNFPHRLRWHVKTSWVRDRLCLTRAFTTSVNVPDSCQQ